MKKMIIITTVFLLGILLYAEEPQRMDLSFTKNITANSSSSSSSDISSLIQKKEKFLKNSAIVVNLFIPFGIGSLVQGDGRGFGIQFALDIIGYPLYLASSYFIYDYYFYYYLGSAGDILLAASHVGAVIGGVLLVASYIYGLVRPGIFYYDTLIEMQLNIETSYQFKKDGDKIDRQVSYSLPVARF